MYISHEERTRIESRRSGGEGKGKKGARQANNAGRKKARGKNSASSDLSEAPGGSEPTEPPMVSVIGGH